MILTGSLLAPVAPVHAQIAMPDTTPPATGHNDAIAQQTRFPGEPSLEINPDIEPGVLLPGNGRPPSPQGKPPPEGPLSAWGQKLDGYGIRLTSLAFDSFENNISTGENTGRSANDVTIFLGTELDLGKLVGLDGGTVHVQGGLFLGRVRNGTNNNWLADSSSVLAGLPFINRDRAEYLTALSYEQKLFADRLDLEIGRINAKRAFDLPNPGNQLSTDDPVFAMDGGTSPAPYAHWGARAAYALSPRWFTGAGVYAANTTENQTFGTDWRLDQATGALLVANGGYETDFSQADFPSRYELVPFYNTSRVKDPLTSALDRPVVAFPHDPAAMHGGAYGVAARLQQTIWRATGPSANPALPQHVDLFGSLSYTPNPYVVAANNQEVGIALFGLTPSRPLDVLTAKVDHLGLNRRAIEFEREARVSVGGADVSTGLDEYRLELNAHIALNRGVALEPVAEYIINPDTSSAPFSAKVPKDGFVLAAMLILYPNTLLGLPGG
jgi:porin